MRNDQGMRALCDQIRQTAFHLHGYFIAGISSSDRQDSKSRNSFCAFCGWTEMLTGSHPILKKAEHPMRRQYDRPASVNEVKEWFA